MITKLAYTLSIDTRNLTITESLIYVKHEMEKTENQTNYQQNTMKLDTLPDVNSTKILNNGNFIKNKRRRAPNNQPKDKGS